MATSYTFEHINRLKTTHVDANTRNLLDGREKLYPDYNYPSGTGMSTVWMGHAHYAPHNRQWQRHDMKKALPMDKVAGQLEFVSEDGWREWQGKRDQHDSKHCGGFGYRTSKQPELKLDGYALNPFNLYRTGVPALTMYNPHNPWPKTDIRTFPTWRGPRAYYGYYHEELDIHHNGGYRYPRDPRVLVNDEDVMKYEYMRNMPHCHQKLPVDFPVLL
jgi:hypothetical protein